MSPRQPRHSSRCITWCLCVISLGLEAIATESASSSPNVIVAIKTEHFLGQAAYRTVPNCKANVAATHMKRHSCAYERHDAQALLNVAQGGQELNCTWVDGRNATWPQADAVWFHIPHVCLPPFPYNATLVRDAPHQLMVGYQVEPPVHCPLMEDLGFMSQFDIEQSFRRCSDVQVPYFYDSDSDIQNLLFADPLPFEEKLDAIAYINSNCHTVNNRNMIVAALMGLAQLPVHSYGACLLNTEMPPHAGNHHFSGKKAVFRQHKFCIAMENSNSADYVSEKLWQAFEAGCLPIYFGAPNVDEFIPTPNSIIDYSKFKGPEHLMEYLITLSKDRAAYQLTQSWRYQPLDSLSPGFRKMALAYGSPGVDPQCQVCQLILSKRLEQAPALKHTPCMANESWLAAARSGNSTWGPGSDDLLAQPHAHRWSADGVWDPMHVHDMNKPRALPPGLDPNHVTLTMQVNGNYADGPTNLPESSPIVATESSPIVATLNIPDRTASPIVATESALVIPGPDLSDRTALEHDTGMTAAMDVWSGGNASLDNRPDGVRGLIVVGLYCGLLAGVIFVIVTWPRPQAGLPV